MKNLDPRYKMQIVRLVNAVADFEFAVNGRPRSGSKHGGNIAALAEDLKFLQGQFGIVFWLDENIDAQVKRYEQKAKIKFTNFA